MSINFDALPSGKPSTLPKKGHYYAEIETAEMKLPKPKIINGESVQGPAYLNMRFGISDKTGKSAGKLFDMLSESDHEIVRYKVRRFIEALNLPITSGSFELKDLAKIVVGKKFIVDVSIDDRDKNYPAKAVVDISTGDIYYPLSDATLIFGEGAAPADDSDLPFTINAPDAADAAPATPGNPEY